MPLTYTQTPYSNLQGSVVNNEVALDYSNLDFRPEIGDTIEVYNDTTKLTDGTGGTTVNYTLDTSNTDVILKVNTFTPGTTISVYRIAKKDTRAIDFQNASVLTEADLDNSAFQTFHIAQEALDTAEQSITVNADGTFNASNQRIVNLADPSGDQDAATKAWVNRDANTTTVAGSIANVNHVAGQISPENNVGTVAGKIADVETVAHLEDGTTATGAVSAVAGKAAEIGRLGTADAVADMAILGTADVVADMNTLATADVVADMNTLGTADVVADMNTLGTADVVSDMNTLATSNVVSDMNTLATSANVTNMANLNATGVIDDLATLGSGKDGKSVGTSGYDSGTKTNIEQIHTVAQQIADVNNFADTYFGTSSSASGPTGTFTAGDLYFSTYNSENKLKVYNGSSWQNATSAVEGIATITEFTPNGSDTHFAFTHDVGLQIVFLNGVRLIQGTDYNSVNSSSSTSNITSGTASHLHFSTPPASGDVLSAMGFGTVTSTAVVPVSGGTFSGDVSFGDNNITNVGDIALDTISSDAGTSIGVTLGTDAGDDFNVGSGKLVVEGDTGRVGVNTSDPDVTLDIHDANPAIDLYDTGTNGYCRIDANGANLTLHADKGGNAGSSTVKFGVDNSVKMTIDSSGNVEVESGNLVIGTAGKGIDFSNQTNTGSSISNQVLEHYERGTFTPTIFTASNSNFAGSGTAGVYLRIGEWITVGMIIQNISWPTSNTSESVSVGGLPFASGEDALGYGWSNIVAYTNTDMNNTLALTTGTSSTVGRFRFSTSTNTNATIADFNTYSSPTRIDLSLSYLAT